MHRFFRFPGSLHSAEDGAAYAISLLMALPLYVAMVALVVEVASLTSAGMTLDAAASAAARSAAAWLPLEGSAELKHRQIKRAAVLALVPAANAGAASSSADAEAEQAFVSAYRRFTPHPLPHDRYLAAKYRAADQATTVTISPSSPRGGDRVTVRVEFRAPIRVPGFGRWLGDSGTGDNATRRIMRELSFTLEPTPHKTHPLGITYDRLR